MASERCLSMGLKVKKVFADYSLTFLSSLLAIGVVQVAVYPCIADRVGGEMYGIFLTVIGIVNSAMPAFGSTLRNASIVTDEDYRACGIRKTDFKYLLMRITPVVSSAVALGLHWMLALDIPSSLVVAILIGCGIVKAYCLIVFRLPIEPIKNTIASFFSCIGYAIGLIFVVRFEWVFLPFLLAEAFSLAYILAKSDVLSGPAKKTIMFPKVSKAYAYLVVTNLVAYCATYIDRILLLPALGAFAVSVYYASSFVGKACTFFVGPMSTVLLSYISVRNTPMTKKQYNTVNAALLVILVVVGIPLVALAPFATNILYPSLAESALPYIGIANAASLLGVANGVNLVIVLKVAPPRCQLVITSFKLVLYCVSILIALLTGELFPFCIALLFSNIVVIAATYLLGRKYVKNQDGAVIMQVNGGE